MSGTRVRQQGEVVVGGDLVLLRGYSEATLAAYPLVREGLAAYTAAVQAYALAKSSFDDAGVVDRSVDVDTALFDLETADRVPGAFAEVLDLMASGILPEDLAWLVPMLQEDPNLAALIALGMSGVPVTGEVSVAMLMLYFDRFDTAAHGGGRDGEVSRDDLEAIADNGDLPDSVRDAARYLLANPSLFDLVETADDHHEDTDGRISRQDVGVFLETNRHLRNLQGAIGELDTADDGGDPDGFVSRNDLEAAAADEDLPRDVRDAARYLLDHDQILEGLAWQRHDDGFNGGFSANDLVGRLVDGQAYVHDPGAAEAFVNSLPVADDGRHGLPIELCSDDGTRALAISALTATGGDLTDVQSVIAHLPETTTAVRQQLTVGYYRELAIRADAVFATAAGATPGDPLSAGHPGANWLNYAPWAATGVGGLIAGDESFYGIHAPMAVRQAGADGNQWIFADVTGRFAPFVELYEQTGGHPSPGQLEAFFADHFDDGDLEIRQGFEAYVAALDAPDPAQRQQLMFQANSLIAIHEQAGADPYLNKIGLGPDSWSNGEVDVAMGAGREPFDTDHDLPRLANDANLVDDAPILDLDPSRLDPGLAGVPVPDIDGWDDEFETSSEVWFEEKGQGERIDEQGYPEDYSPNPDTSLVGTGAGGWADYEDRMWYIHRLFEQLHTDPSLFRTEALTEDLWLDAGTMVAPPPEHP